MGSLRTYRADGMDVVLRSRGGLRGDYVLFRRGRTFDIRHGRIGRDRLLNRVSEVYQLLR